MSFISLLQTAPASQSMSGQMTSLVATIVMMIAIFYFFIIRPQNKKQKELEKMISALKKGDKVVTIGGIHGVVSSVKQDTIIVKVDDNAKLEFNRTAIATVVTDEAKAEKAEKPAKTEKTAKAAKNTEEKNK